MIDFNDIIEAIKRLSKGGEGSGNFGHDGRPGEVGGSGSGGAGVAPKPAPPTKQTGAGTVYDSQAGAWVKPKDHYAQKEYHQKMEKRLKEHDAEIKAANDMLDEIGLVANRAMHEKINLKTDIIAAKIRVAVLSKYGESELSMGMSKI